MSIEQINSMYDNLYSSQYNDYAKKKTESLSQLDTQFNQGKQKFYEQRDTTAYDNARQVQKTRDYMAKNNLMGSGESVDAQLRASTDYSNSMGGIQRSENDFNKTIDDNRFKVNQNFDGDVNALRGQVDSERAKAIMDFRRQEEQFNLQRQQMEMQRQSQAASAQRASAASKKNEMPTDPNKALYLLRMMSLDDPLRAGQFFANYYNDVDGMSYVVKEAQDKADNYKYYADKFGLWDSKNNKYKPNVSADVSGYYD